MRDLPNLGDFEFEPHPVGKDGKRSIRSDWKWKVYGALFGKIYIRVTKFNSSVTKLKVQVRFNLGSARLVFESFSDGTACIGVRSVNLGYRCNVAPFLAHTMALYGDVCVRARVLERERVSKN